MVGPLTHQGATVLVLVHDKVHHLHCLFRLLGTVVFSAH